MILRACGMFATLADSRCTAMVFTEENVLVATSLGHLATMSRGKIGTTVLAVLGSVVLIMVMERVQVFPGV